MILWTLVFVLNGTVQKTEPMLAEACIMNMLNRPAAQQPYCVNPEGRKMYHPGDCETIKGWPLYCKKRTEEAREGSQTRQTS